VTTATIPHRAVFRAQEVCELAELQPYVLRSWEEEFPDLGVSKSADGPRLYRRSDVELVLKLKQLLFVDGLTIAGARKQLVEEGAAAAVPDSETITDADLAAVVDKQALKSLHDVRQGLGWILQVLDGGADADGPGGPYAARSTSSRRSSARPSKPVRSKARPAKSSLRRATPKRAAGRKKR
jgi:DNA-binding transcriptional MerR regulator